MTYAQHDTDNYIDHGCVYEAIAKKKLSAFDVLLKKKTSDSLDHPIDPRVPKVYCSPSQVTFLEPGRSDASCRGSDRDEGEGSDTRCSTFFAAMKG